MAKAQVRTTVRVYESLAPKSDEQLKREWVEAGNAAKDWRLAKNGERSRLARLQFARLRG